MQNNYQHFIRSTTLIKVFTEFLCESLAPKLCKNKNGDCLVEQPIKTQVLILAAAIVECWSGLWVGNEVRQGWSLHAGFGLCAFLRSEWDLFHKA